MSRWGQVLFWSVISAAFIGPGTVTTAATAGVDFGYSLLWALVFSTAACLVLQEAAARLAIVSGKSLGQALREGAPAGPRRVIVLLLVLGAVVMGCAAYQAGNILGGVVGAGLMVQLSRPGLTLLIGGLAGLLLLLGAPGVGARVLGVIVGVMGICFLGTAFLLQPALSELVAGSLVPTIPASAGVLVLGLVGTTVVPYNLFLGSGLAVGRGLGDLRFGLGVAVLLGGLISMGVVVVGAALEPPFSFERLSSLLGEELGSWASMAFAIGLLAAGLSSAVTAPLAAALTARGLFGSGDGRWGPASWRFRTVWGAVLLTGIAFGVTEIRPVPIIVAAQAFNGVLLPLVAAFLLLAVNDRRVMGASGLNRAVSNGAMGLVSVVAVLLGVRGVLGAVAVVTGRPGISSPESVLWVFGVSSIVLTPLLVVAVRARRRAAENIHE